MSENFPSAEDGITEITIGSGLEDEAHLQPETVNAEYIQDQKFKGVKRSFKIFNDTQMYYSLKSFRNKDNSKKRIHLAYISDQPGREVFISWRWMSTSLAALVWSMLLFYIGLYSEWKSETIVIVAVLMGTFSLVGFMVFYYRTHDKLIFKSCVGDIPLFEIGNHKPGNEQFDTFMRTLKLHIEKAQGRKSMHERLVGELSDLRRLRDENVVSTEQYEEARNKIFRHEAYQAK